MRTRRALSLLPAVLLALCLLCSSCAEPGASPALFVHAPLSADGGEAVRWADSEGISSGTEAENTSPEQQLSLAELAAFLYRYAYSPTPHFRNSVLAIYRDEWYCRPLNWCCDFGILSPARVTGRNHPTDKLTRGDGVKLLWRYALLWEQRSVAADERCLDPFFDAPQTAEDRQAWSWALSAGVVRGITAHSLSPGMPLDRAAFLTMLYRYDTQFTLLQSERLLGRRLRGWQRTLLETGERALGAAWEDEAYELGPDGVPSVIDCSGLVNWVFSVTGVLPYEDMNCNPLWCSDFFTPVFKRIHSETGNEFLLRCRERLQPGDLLFSHDSVSGDHVMFFLGSTPTELYVFHSRRGKGVCTETLAIAEDSGYIEKLIGVKRYLP